MNVRTVLAAAAMVSMVAVTGCAGKKTSTGIDSTALPTDAAQTSSATSSTTTTAGATPISSGISNSAITDAPLKADSPTTPPTTPEVTETAAPLKTVYFGFDAHILTAEAREILAGNAQYLENNRLVRVTVEGHADERGSDDYNLALAEKRAVAAKRYLQSLGISEERMEAVSFGENKPAVEGDDEAAYSRNRRVDFVIVK